MDQAQIAPRANSPRLLVSKNGSPPPSQREVALGAEMAERAESEEDLLGHREMIRGL